MVLRPLSGRCHQWLSSTSDPPQGRPGEDRGVPAAAEGEPEVQAEAWDLNPALPPSPIGLSQETFGLLLCGRYRGSWEE